MKPFTYYLLFLLQKREEIMKELRVLFLAFVAIVTIGCGGGGSNNPTKTKESNSSYEIIKNDANVEPVYKYNSDKSALLHLNNSRVNEYKDIEDDLANLRGEQKAFNARINRYISELLYFNSLMDSTPSYAPRGSNKSLIVDVKNGKIDYSQYSLNGDINKDFKVDFKDIELFIDALYNNSNDLKYDANKDSIIDLKDLIYILARVGIEIAYFDFYNQNMQKINISTRAIADSKIFAYSGSEKKIIVVAKDINKASGYIDGGLSDSDSEWYHQKGWKLEGAHARLMLLRSVNQEIIQASREIINKEIKPYLTGWHFSVHFISNANLEEFGEYSYSVESWRWFFESEIEPKIKSHFSKTDMKRPLKKYLDSRGYACHIGYDEQSMATEVFTKDLIVKRSFVLDNKRVVLKELLRVSSILFESEADKTFKAHINSSKKLNGKVTLSRVGPTPKEESFEGDVNDNEIEASDVPYGAYDIEVETDCGCKLPLANKAVFTGKKLNLSIDTNKLKANLALIIKSKDNKALKNKQVTITSKECIKDSFSQSKTTNISGQVIFKDIPIGEYSVSVSGKTYTIKVCQNTTKTLILPNNKWIYKWINHDSIHSGSITIKNLTIDCNNLITVAGYDMCMIDYKDKDVTLTGNFGVDLEESYITIERDGIWIQVKNLAYDKIAFEYIFATATKTEHTGMCYFSWKDEYFENLKNYKSFVITGDRCIVEFKTCSDEECSE